MSRSKSVLLLATLVLGAIPAKAATITYTGDASVFSPGAFLDPASPEGMARLIALGDVKSYVESTIANPGEIVVSLSAFADPMVSTLASGGQFYTGVAPTASGVVFGNAHKKLVLGMPSPGPSGFISFNAAKDTYLGADPLAIPATETDFRSIVLHEITHVLGWASFMKLDDKTSALTDFLKATFPATYGPLGEVYSVYDTLMVDTMGFTVILPDGTANPGALPAGGAKIASPHAIAANGGDLITTAVVPFGDPDMTHLDGAIASIMNSTLGDGDIEREWSEIDLGVLRDLGYVIVPEPSSSVLLILGTVLCWFLPRLRRRRSA
jgi:hypothetical protein